MIDPRMAESRTIDQEALLLVPFNQVMADVRIFLIADIRGYTRFTEERGDEAAAMLALRFATLSREVIGRHGGQVLELRGDEALIVFASVRNALRAAVELQVRYTQETARDSTMPLLVGIGMDAGEAIAVEDGYRGAALNLASRLCSLAGPGEILASAGIAHLAGKVDGLRFTERGTIPLKGFYQPVRVVQVLASEASQRPATQMLAFHPPTQAPTNALPIGGFLGALPTSVMVAREAEIKRIIEALDTVLNHAGRFILLTGEPGAGKTRLAQETTLLARNRGFLIAAGRCNEPQQTIPFYPFLDILASLYSAIPPALQGEVAVRWPDLGSLLPEYLPAVPVTMERHQDLRLFRAVIGFITALSAVMPLALLLDDLHWADSATLDLLHMLAQQTRGQRVLLLGTYRDVEVNRRHPLEAVLYALNRDRLVEEVSVRRLSRDNTATLISTILDNANISADFISLVYRRTDGNPFFVEEVLRASVDRGDVYLQDGSWTQRRTADIDIPRSVRAAIGHRLTRMSTRAQEVLLEASVLGQSVPFTILAQIGGQTESELEQALEEIVTAGLLREADDDCYEFNHALTQQTLYAELPARRRRRLHLAVGEALEQQGQQGQPQRAAELAWHFLEGDDPLRALPYALVAGDNAEAIFGHAEAERHYRIALDLAVELRDRHQEATSRERLGGVLQVVARYEEALAQLEAAAALYHEAGEIASEARTVARIGMTHRYQGTAREGLSRVQSFVATHGEDVGSAELAALYTALAFLHFLLGQSQEELATIEQARRLALEVGDRRLLAAIELRRGTALGDTGDTHEEEVRAALLHSVQLAEETDDLATLTGALNNLSFVYQRQGDLATMYDCLQRALAVAERLGDPSRIAFQLMRSGNYKIMIGDWVGARQLLEQSLGLAQSLAVPQATLMALMALGSLQVQMGEWDAAAQSLDYCLASTESDGDRQVQLCAAVALAYRDLLQDRPAAVRPRLEPLLSGLPNHGMIPHRLMIFEPLIRADLACGNVEAAQQTLTTAIGCITPFYRDAVAGRISLSLLQGMISAVQNLWIEADKALTESLTLARTIGLPFDAALAQYELGVLHSRCGNSAAAQDYLSEALRTFQQLGAQPFVALSETALSRLQSSV